MENEAQLRHDLTTLFATQRLAVLGTHRSGQPYQSLVGFASTADLAQLVFATTRATRKFANLSADPRVSMLIDSRTNQDEDFHHAMAVTATGAVAEVTGEDRQRWEELFLAKLPHLKEFVASPTCALLKLTVNTYYVVHRFQSVRELRLTP